MVGICPFLMGSAGAAPRRGEFCPRGKHAAAAAAAVLAAVMDGCLDGFVLVEVGDRSL